MDDLNEFFFPTVLEAEKSRIKVQVDSVSGEGHLPGLQAATFSLYPHMMEGEGRGGELGTMGSQLTSCNTLVASTPVQPCCY